MPIKNLFIKERILRIAIFGTLAIGLAIKIDLFHRPFSNQTVQAVSDLIIDWGVPSGQPIFVVENMLPGDTETKTVRVVNGASTNRPIGLKSQKSTEVLNFSEILEITILKDGSLIFGPKKLAEFFAASAGPDYISFDTLTPGQTAIYTFNVVFPKQSSNNYQNARIIFDLTIGIAFRLPAECQGKKYENIVFGSENSDILRGGNKKDIILGFEGDDILDGGNDDDCLIAGPGNDRVFGGNSDDVLWGDEGNDILDGGNGDDWLFGGRGNDTIRGSNGKDRIRGDEGDDTMTGDNGNDNLWGGQGNDRADGGNGNDECEAETKKDCER